MLNMPRQLVSSYRPNGSAQLIGRSPMHGRYSEILVYDDHIEKRNQVMAAGGTVERAREALCRFRDTQRYLLRLHEIGVNMPQMRIALDLTSLENPAIVIYAQKLRAPHNLIQVARAPWEQKLSLIEGMVRELLKVVDTHLSERPIGYDGGFDNFVTYEGRCYLVDIYPPRLGYTPQRGGAVMPLQRERLLINYPEQQDLCAEREAQMRGYYYSPRGVLLHFTTWAIGAALAADEIRGALRGEINARLRVEQIVALNARVLRERGNAELADDLQLALWSSEGRAELEVRAQKTPLRIEKALAQWEDACRLF